MATAKKKTAQKLNPPKPTAEPTQEATHKESKKTQIHALLERPEVATIEEMAKLTSWQNHMVRGFLSMLKKAKDRYQRTHQ